MGMDFRYKPIFEITQIRSSRGDAFFLVSGDLCRGVIIPIHEIGLSGSAVDEYGGPFDVVVDIISFCCFVVCMHDAIDYLMNLIRAVGMLRKIRKFVAVDEFFDHGTLFAIENCAYELWYAGYIM
ncbi:MAG: hypothetical protein JWN50_7 [Parcubacteria group bacterium]|nr:hypothetical protein [Parcubacteria group bacterium]